MLDAVPKTVHVDDAGNTITKASGKFYGGVQAAFQKLIGNDDVAEKLSESAKDALEDSNNAAMQRGISTGIRTANSDF